MSTEQGLEKAARTPAVITTPDEYKGALQKWQSEHYNVLTPFTNVSGIAPSFGLIASVIKINPDPAFGEVYSGLPFLKKDEYAPAKIGLRKLAECGGISTSTQRTDPRTIAYYWEFKAIASYRGLDGSLTTREATFEWDLRDGSDRLKGWTPNQISEGRKNGLRNCEARAINAAIRECGCGIKQKYTRAELDRPFVVVRVAFQPDMADPDVKRMVTQQALMGASALYPTTGAHALPAAGQVVDHDDTPRHVGSGSTAPAGSEPKPDQPPIDGAVKIAKVDFKDGQTGARKWRKYTIVDSNGVAYSTFDKQHADDADRFKASNDWVEIVTETDGAFTNIIEIVKAGSEPRLPGVDEV